MIQLDFGPSCGRWEGLRRVARRDASGTLDHVMLRGRPACLRSPARLAGGGSHTGLPRPLGAPPLSQGLLGRILPRHKTLPPGNEARFFRSWKWGTFFLKLTYRLGWGHLNRGKVYIRHVLTHQEYDRGAWKR
jgi:hypothetical protein